MKGPSRIIFALWVTTFLTLSAIAAPHHPPRPSATAALAPLVISAPALSVNATNGVGISRKTQKYWPKDYGTDGLVRVTGCENGKFVGSCGENESCPFWVFTVDLDANKEYCIYHTGKLDFTTCFKFSMWTHKEDANWLIEGIVTFDVFHMSPGFLNMGFSSLSWLQGGMAYASTTGPAYTKQLFGIAMAQGNHGSLGVTLPPKPTYYESEFLTWHLPSCDKPH
ncbi:hypothetical protein BGZ83_002346 [Gryganskiella cystojenkinii]|nr:hypothetical protein BGZ83_002346 [Gryganskiella cystojenkinii]